MTTPAGFERLQIILAAKRLLEMIGALAMQNMTDRHPDLRLKLVIGLGENHLCRIRSGCGGVHRGASCDDVRPAARAAV